MQDTPKGDLTLIELLIHQNEEIRRLAQRIAHILIDTTNDKDEITQRCKQN